VWYDGHQAGEFVAELLIHEADTYHMARGRRCRVHGGGEEIVGRVVTEAELYLHRFKNFFVASDGV
jgi:hypothetical protein